MSSQISKLGLSTARFGSVTTPDAAARLMPQAQAFATVALAADAGLSLIDLPSDRPDAEQALAEVLPPRADLRIVAKTGRAVNAGVLERQARLTLDRLGRDHAHALITRASSLLGPEGPALWTGMRRLRDKGLFQAMGVAACVCDDPLGLARRFKPDLMQLPASLVDQRLITNGALEAICGLGVEIQLRSALTQGLLFLGGHELPAGFAGMIPGLSHVRLALARAGVDPLHAALAFALARPEASAVIVGVASPSELRAVLAAASAPAPAMDWDALALAAPCLLAPRCAAAA